MKGIILAAGRGSRLGNLTSGRPKCLTPFRGRPLLEWQIQALAAGGIKQIGVVTGYRRELIKPYGLTEFFNEKWATVNMVRSLDCAYPWLDSEACLVSYSDIFYEASAVDELVHTDADIAVVYFKPWLEHWTLRYEDPLVDAETFRVDPQGYVTDIGGAPRSLNDVQGQYMGLLRFSPNGWRETQRVLSLLDAEQRDQIHMTATLQLLINSGRISVQGIPFSGVWGEIDTPRDLAVYEVQTPEHWV